MSCPSCGSPLESNSRFCGVCGYLIQTARSAAAAASTGPGMNSPAARPPPTRATIQRQPPLKLEQTGGDIYLGLVLNNRFKIESKIGEGGFGVVYGGTQVSTGRKVALKFLHPSMTKDENLVARFRREGMLLCRLRSDHTITTYDFDQAPNGTLYIAMELLEGKTLSSAIRDRGTLGWRRTSKIVMEMCSSLAEAHAQGVIHRDLKPENVFLERRPGNPEFVKVIDFGTAKVMSGDSLELPLPQLTTSGQTIGTLAYMSPEQLIGQQLDGRSDLYALGVMAYKMLTGAHPLGEHADVATLLKAQLEDWPVPPSQRNPEAEIPYQVDEIVMLCLDRDPTARMPDAASVARALQEALDANRGDPVLLRDPNLSTRQLAVFAKSPDFDIEFRLQALHEIRRRRQIAAISRVQRNEPAAAAYALEDPHSLVECFLNNDSEAFQLREAAGDALGFTSMKVYRYSLEQTRHVIDLLTLLSTRPEYALNAEELSNLRCITRLLAPQDTVLKMISMMRTILDAPDLKCAGIIRQMLETFATSTNGTISKSAQEVLIREHWRDQMPFWRLFQLTGATPTTGVLDAFSVESLFDDSARWTETCKEIDRLLAVPSFNVSPLGSTALREWAAIVSDHVRTPHIVVLRVKALVHRFATLRST